MKTKEELNAIKEEVETLNKKLAELTEDEFAQVTGGVGYGRRLILTGGVDFIIPEHNPNYEPERYFDTDPKNKKFE